MNTHELGTTQEQRVADWMQQRGFYIVEKNFRCKFGEIDLTRKGWISDFCGSKIS